jgi:hypothetical protein
VASSLGPSRACAVIAVALTALCAADRQKHTCEEAAYAPRRPRPISGLCSLGSLGIIVSPFVLQPKAVMSLSKPSR